MVSPFFVFGKELGVIPTEYDAQKVMTALESFPDNGLTGRRKILTNVKAITAQNVKDVLSKALVMHQQNVREISYLWDVYRGKQDVRNKVKYERENINNKIVINRANEIVTFKTAYLLNEPVQYVSTESESTETEKVKTLNDFMHDEDKDSKDKEIVDWMHICGVAERLTLTDELAGVKDGAPFYIYTLDPREAFVIYSSRIGQRPMAGVIIQKDEQDKDIYTVYTETECFTVQDDKVSVASHILGGIPLVEYINNEARQGAFEIVLGVLNGINDLESNALDSIQDFVNGFDVFQNCEIADGDYGKLAIGGQALMIKTTTQGMEAKVYRVASELSQSGVQQRIDSLSNSYIEICGMPNRNGGSSTSDTGQAVIFRDGWSEAESRAKDTEKLFKRSEKAFLRIVLNICRVKAGLDMSLKDIEINFPRKSLNNLQSKIQGLSEMLANGFIHPMDAYNALGDVFGDKNAAYMRGMKWHQEQEAKEVARQEAELDNERKRIANESVQTERFSDQQDKQGNAEKEE